MRPRQPREKIARLRGLSGEKGFALEPLSGRQTYRLIYLAFGHAVKRDNGATSFSVDQAIAYLRAWREDDGE